MDESEFNELSTILTTKTNFVVHPTDIRKFMLYEVIKALLKLDIRMGNLNFKVNWPKSGDQCKHRKLSGWN